jgi:hypothetical protein
MLIWVVYEKCDESFLMLVNNQSIVLSDIHIFSFESEFVSSKVRWWYSCKNSKKPVLKWYDLDKRLKSGFKLAYWHSWSNVFGSQTVWLYFWHLTFFLWNRKTIPRAIDYIVRGKIVWAKLCNILIWWLVAIDSL